MEEKKEQPVNEDGYQLDLDETFPGIDDLMEEAVAAVEKTAGKRGSAPAHDEAATDEDQLEAEADDDGTEESGNGGEKLSEVQALRDRLVRTLADFDNFRKRSEREKETIHRFALFDVLKDFLGVSDNLERALAASGNADDLKQGVEMIVRQFSDLLRRHGVEPIDAVDQKFDPAIHEAVAREEREDVQQPTVTAELQRGYLLHDRLLRPAMVNVAMPEPAKGPAAAESDETPSDGD